MERKKENNDQVTGECDQGEIMDALCSNDSLGYVDRLRKPVATRTLVVAGQKLNLEHASENPAFSAGGDGVPRRLVPVSWYR